MSFRQVSLNIHDPLTFDGTEICLHPDLGKFSVGDLVEIRVWDTNAQTANISSTERPQHQRQRSNMIPPPSCTLSPSAASSHSSNNNNNDNGGGSRQQSSVVGGVEDEEINKKDDVEDAISVVTTTGVASAVSTTAELILPLTTTTSTPSSPFLPAKTVTLTSSTTNSNEGGLPPVPPKGAFASGGASLKPAVRGLGGSSSGVHRGRFSSAASAASSSRRHVRDLSDVTVDSMNWSDYLPPTGSEEHDTQQQQYPVRHSFTILVTEKSLKSLKGPARTQVSILRHVADLYHLSSYDIVSVHTVDKDPQLLASAAADFVLVTFKDQFISRGEMHLFQETLIGSWVYEGKRLHENHRGFQATAREIRHSDQRTVSGLITEKTTIAFRSRSARIIWLVQLSAEMWDYASPYEKQRGSSCTTTTEQQHQAESVCELYFDRWITFVHKLFDKWKEMEVTHSLTVVFFSRSFLSSTSSKSSIVVHGGGGAPPRDVYGRRYKDHYRVVLENETCPSNWHSLIVKLKEAFVKYPTEVGWTWSSSHANEESCQPSNASRGNVLEAVNVTLNLLQFHFLDRDLHRTGNSIVVVSAGNGVFEVDKGLARITYQRMLDNGIGSDMLSLGLPALHIAPFFIYTIVDKSDEGDDEETIAQDYEVPHWMHLSFVSYESDSWVFVDHLIEKNDVTVNRNAVSDNSELNIAPNGFLMPRRKADDSGQPCSSPLLRPATSRFKPPPSSPAKETGGVYNTRKLIEGRDFRDILDACRPRDFGVLPSALTALLKLQSSLINVEDPPPLQRKDNASRDVREWGALEDARSTRLSRRTLSLGHESDTCISPTLAALSSTPPRQGVMRFNDNNSSNSSSYASNSSLGFLCGGGNKNILQLQRSLSGDSLSTSGDSVATSDDEDSNAEDRIRKIMAHHDKAAARVSSDAHKNSPSHQMESDHGSQRVTSFVAGQGSTPSVLVQAKGRREPMGKTPQTAHSSGLDAALKHYRIYGGHQQSGNPENKVKLLSRAGSMGRITSNISNPSSFQRLSQFSGTGLSPLLLPPVVTANDAPNKISGDVKQPIFAFDRNRTNNTHEPRTGRSPDDAVGNRYERNREGVFGRTSLQSPGRKSHNEVSTAGRLLGVSPTDRRISYSGLTSEPTSISMSISPPRISSPKDTSKMRSRQSTQLRNSPKDNMKVRSNQRSAKTKHPLMSRRKRALNPFRQQDEDEVLKTRSFNRRRWSHVFPRGEVEFKRHAGPNWKSLTAPAILPLGVDYFPTRDALMWNYTQNMYTLTLSEFPRKNYTSHLDLLSEMVRQRLAQDFQLVDPSIVDPNFFKYRREVVSRDTDSDVVRFFLSMGHRLQVLTYDSSADLVEVESYMSKQAQKHAPPLRYQYFSFCQETGTYQKVIQSFTKYASIYLWNSVDRIVCGNPDREMRDGMRCRRLMFGIIPEDFQDNAEAETEYLKRFERLFEHFEKIRDKETDTPPLGVKTVSSENRAPPDAFGRTESKTGVEGDSMKRFYVQLRKGKRDIWEWMEVAIDSTLDTTWSYRIMFSWLVGSAGRIDTQVQSLKRRCTQFGLRLIPFPHITIERNLFIQPFKAPVFVTFDEKGKAKKLDNALSLIDYVHDGVFKTDQNPLLDCMEKKDMFKFLSGRFPARFVNGRQLVHRSGTIFVRILTDSNGLAIVIVLGNHRFLMSNKDNKLQQQYTDAYAELDKCLTSL